MLQPATEAITALQRLGFEVDLAPGKTLPDGTSETVCWVRLGDEAICLEVEELAHFMSEAIQ